MWREFLQALHVDRRKRFQGTGASIETSMYVGKVQEAWTQISQWYRQARVAQAPPTTEALDEVTVERAELYRRRPLEGLKFQLLVRQADIEEGIPTEAEVAEAVRGLK